MRRNAATNSFRHFVEIAQRATGVRRRRQRLAEALAERGEHQPLAVGQRR
jgi:hypothetical protein